MRFATGLLVLVVSWLVVSVTIGASVGIAIVVARAIVQ